ncbi:MAG: TonB family protein [Candidatus Acidiferrales bacterium]
MTPTKEHLEIGSSSAESENSQVKGRPRPESAHLRADAVSLEIPIKVHGSMVPNASLNSSPGATSQAQPFEEQTTTMIVFPQGGVLKMSTTVSAGQVMVLTSLKSRQDAICRVIKVRAYGKTQSYVEVEFTSPQPGYWGVYFPTDGPEVARMAPPQPTMDSPSATTPVPGAPVASNATPMPAAQEPAAAPPASAVRPPTSSLEGSPAGLNAASLITSTEEEVPNVSWAPASAIASPAAKAAEPTVQAEARQAASVPPRPSAPAKLPESLFASIGTKEDVEYVATSTKGTRQNPFSESAKHQTIADADISAAIDALIAPSASAASISIASASPTADSANRAAAGERLRETPPANAPSPVAKHVKVSVSDAAESESGAALPVPKQMFGVMLDSAKPAIERSSRSSGGNMLLPIAIAVMLAVAGGGAYYYHTRTSANARSAAPNGYSAAPAVEPSVSQAPITQSADASAAGATQMPDQSAAVQSPDAGLPANTARDLMERSAARAEDSSAKPRSSEPFSNRHAASPAEMESQPAASVKSQPTVAIPSTFGALNMHPVARTGGVDSAGAAPALDSSGSPTMPAVSGPSIAPLAPNVPAPPKPAQSVAPVRVGGRIQPPRLVSSVLPMYPAIAQQANVTGTVVIDTTIDKNGDVSKMRVVSGPELLRGAALSALRKWKYEPSKLNGEPISVQMVVSIQFH